ncbi:histone H3 [Colletotrichum phormii]|uniref:Histone H3 n=1 Tax=Colletotrichum phormii TaxID=359342 RepID=A0AAI9ZP24_9PEZI|nr:histone H3 [Colletotrichum phormii]KAK1634184.1 histone H3 [Colletotrichum phormii]
MADSDAHTPSPAPSIGPRIAPPSKRQRRFKPGVAALREIRKIQQSTSFCLQKTLFQRLVREVTQSTKHAEHEGGLRIQASASEALQVASEDLLTSVFEMSNLAAIHAHRVTIQQKDMVLVKNILTIGDHLGTA